jgi:hypothetical protein
MRSQTNTGSDGFLQDLLPLMKNGLVIFRSILDILIDRIEEMEESKQINVRRDIYASIIDALQTEIQNVRQSEADAEAVKIRIEALDAIISVLLHELDELDKKSKKGGKRPKKVKID